MKTSSNLLKRFIPLLILSLAVACSKPAATDARLEPPLVVISKPVASAGAHTVYTGVVTARVESNLGFRVSGKVIQRLVDVGQEVQKGQILMRLDRNDLVLNYAAQEAAVATAQAKLTQTIADEARLNGLSEQGAISAQAYDAAKAALTAAESAVNAAKAQAAIAKNADSYADLVADADGIIVGVSAEPGQVVSSGQVVIRLAKNGSREAEVYFPESVRPTVDSEATAKIYSEQSKKYKVRLRELSKTANPGSRTFTARYVIPDSSALPLGSTVSIQIEAGETRLQIPLSAIHDDGKTQGIWIVNADNATVSRRKIQVEQTSAEFAFVTGEIRPDEHIVALGAHLLHEGEQVKIADNSKVALL